MWRTDKGEIEEYLKASGVPHAVILTAWFAENLWKYVSAHLKSAKFSLLPARSLGSLQKTDTGYTIPVPKFGPDDVQSSTWVKHDFGAAAVALLSNYADPSKGVIGGSFPVVSMKFTYPQLAAAIAKGAHFYVKDRSKTDSVQHSRKR
jgi:hypothetical protein